MTGKDIRTFVSNAKEINKKISNSASASKSLLVKAGICTKSGHLTANYK